MALVSMALLSTAPLEALPIHHTRRIRPKRRWYYLGIAEMLPLLSAVVAGVLVPGLVVMALLVNSVFQHQH